MSKKENATKRIKITPSLHRKLKVLSAKAKLSVGDYLTTVMYTFKF